MYVLTSLAEAISGTLAVSSYLLSHTALPDLAKADGYHLLYNAIQLASLVWLPTNTAHDNTPAGKLGLAMWDLQYS